MSRRSLRRGRHPAAPQAAVPSPILWALLLVCAAALAVIVVGGLRGTDSLEPVLADDEPPITQGTPPPWPWRGPQLRPLSAPRPAAAPTPAPIVAATPLPEPTAPPTPLPAASATTASAPLVAAPLPAVTLSGLRHYWQTWNNCGPATLAMNLSYYGSALGQADIGSVLRRYAEDKNVSPDELAAYAQSQGYRAEVRVNGSAELARAFLSNGIPLLIETWLEETPNDGLGHYRLLVGYDDAAGHWIGYDSYVSTNLVSSDPAAYAGIRMDYAQTDAWWQVFNRTYVLVYPPEREALVRSILGDAADPAVMWQQALARADAELAATPTNAFAHFNRGTVLTQLGDFAGAAAAYDQARSLGLPWRMLWYQFGPFAAYTQTGRSAEVLELGAATLASAGGGIEEIHYWRGRAYAAQGNQDAARQEWTTALTLNPDYAPARTALAP